MTIHKPAPALSAPGAVINHTELASQIAEARAWERLTGVPNPKAIDRIIHSWEQNR
jgi:hypothetical protein